MGISMGLLARLGSFLLPFFFLSSRLFWPTVHMGPWLAAATAQGLFWKARVDARKFSLHLIQLKM